jgi:hypothetical protein
VRSLWAVVQLARRIQELKKALVYNSDAPFYVEASFIPFLADTRNNEPTDLLRRRRIVEAYFAWKGLHVIPVYGFQTGDEAIALIGHEGCVYPIRDVGVSFEHYEVAVTFIRDGMAILDAFETAAALT